MSQGRVVGICIGPEPDQPMQIVAEAVAVAGRGLEGDRYFQPGENGDPTAEITLIESEAIEAAAAESGVDIRPEDTRRNIITSGVRLDDLLGRKFRLGEVEVEALEPNPPCRHLVELAGSRCSGRSPAAAASAAGSSRADASEPGIRSREAN